jgi:hypothetical protein
MPEIKAMIVMDGEGARVAAKYYSRGSFPDRASETELEKKLFRKARGAGRVHQDAGALQITGTAQARRQDKMPLKQRFGGTKFV